MCCAQPLVPFTSTHDQDDEEAIRRGTYLTGTGDPGRRLSREGAGETGLQGAFVCPTFYLPVDSSFQHARITAVGSTWSEPSRWVAPFPCSEL